MQMQSSVHSYMSTMRMVRASSKLGSHDASLLYLTIFTLSARCHSLPNDFAKVAETELGVSVADYGAVGTTGTTSSTSSTAVSAITASTVGR